MIIFTVIISTLHEKNTPTYLKTAMIALIIPLIIDSFLGFRPMLNVCIRLRAEVTRRVLNGYKRLVKDSNIDNHGFMEFDTVAPIGELRILTSYKQAE